MVYPPGGFPTPVGSFTQPVIPPGVDPTSGDLVYIGVNCAWIPYIAGALTQLLLESTWEVNTEEEFVIVQGQAISLIQLMNCRRLPTLSDLCGLMGQDGDCDMGCCLRFQDGKLQMLSCGEWVDVPGQSGSAPIQPAQPGGGSPQPQPNGGEREYCGAMANGSPWLIPTPVSSGDTLLFSNLEGAWNDTRFLQWFCPDGWAYIAGECIPQIPTQPLDPVPTALHMQIVVQIDGTFYDCLQTDLDGNPTTFVVPAGHSNAQAVIQANTDTLADVAGTVSFCVMVTNNAVGSWEQRFDFTTGPQGFSAYNGQASYAPGSGWTDPLVHSGPNNYRNVSIQRSWALSSTITRVRVGTSSTLGSNPQTADAILNPGSHLAINTSPVGGVHEYDSGAISQTGVTNLHWDWSHGEATYPTDPGGTQVVQYIILNGLGVNPFA